ncbi:MAG: VOC family protein [Anaerolineae bacterium]|nr:VOC family protein [Anaerolineae bacterium]MBT3712773.1 VOC family protein [Anaerolineae bacterium]MBT4311228.1 VOC family protein [Anaerolineae bacterium]MBT4459281.1 VOC family protein [Anaerolineae bacterium]MBT4841293.1 VOC family protein [Anaerolineae bacterium]
MKQNLNIITLGVKDYERSYQFYTEILGWKPTKSSGDEITFFKAGGIVLALYPREELADDAQISPEGSGFSGFTLAHNMRSEAEVDALIEELKEKGVKIVKEPQKVFWGGYSSYFADPDDFLWEVAYNPYSKFDEDGNLIFE